MLRNHFKYHGLALALCLASAGTVLADDVNTHIKLLGDVDGNQTVNISDASALVTHLKGNTPTGFDQQAADVDATSVLNISDYSGIINLIKGKGVNGGTASSLVFTASALDKTFGDATFFNDIYRAGSNSAVQFSSSDENVARVDATTGEVTIVGVGTATITATLPAADGFSQQAVSATVTVQKATTSSASATIANPATLMTTEPTANTDAEDNNPEYTGNPIPLVNEGEKKPGAGTVKYLVTTSATPVPGKNATGWTTEVPEESNAGEYYVWYYVEGNDNHDETEVCSEPIHVTIDKAATPEVTTQPAAVTGDLGYTGTAQPLVTAGEVDGTGGTLMYYVSTSDDTPTTSSEGWTSEVPTATDAGTYHIWYYVRGDANHEDGPVTSLGTKVINGTINTDSTIHDWQSTDEETINGDIVL